MIRLNPILSGKLPRNIRGLNSSLKGDEGESEKSFDTMIIGFVIAVMVIYMLIATLFRSYLQPLIILTTIHLA